MPADSAVGAGVTPVFPMRRGQAGCGAFRLGRVWEQTATGSRAGACRLRCVGRRCLAPVGQGALRGCVFDAVCPCGAKALLSMARRILGFIAGESYLRGGLPLNGGRAARPGDGSMPSCAPWDRRVHEVIPQGERRALPAPAQGSRPLRIPFWEAASIFPSPVPQNAADGKPLLVGLPSSMRTTAPSGTKRSASAPCSWGGCASTWRRRLRPPALPAASTRRRRLWLPTLSASAWAVVLASAWPR